MKFQNSKKNFYLNIITIIICFLPLSLVFSRFIAELILIVVIVFFVILNFIHKESRKYYKSKFFRLFIFFNIIILISTLLSENVLSSIRTSLFYFRFGFLVISIQYLLENKKNFKDYFLYSLGITLLVIAIYSILQVTMLHNTFHPVRVSGFFGSELVQGSFFVRMLPLFLGLIFLIKKKYLINTLLITSILIGIIIIFLSGERAAIALLFILLSLVLLFYPVSIKIKIISCFVILVTLGLLMITFENTKKRIVDDTLMNVYQNKQLQVFSYGHQSHFKTAIEIIKQNYLLGIGPRNFRVECKKNQYEYIGEYRCSTHPHNTYLEIFAETGIVGFLIVVICFIYITVNLINLIFKENKLKNFPLFLFNLTIFINLFPFLPTGSFFNNWISILYYLPIGFLLFEKNKISKNP